MSPDEYEDEGFTYYNENVQDRLAYTLLQLTQEGDYTLESPLAILNPFGTRLQRPVPVLPHRRPHPGDLHGGGGGLFQLCGHRQQPGRQRYSRLQEFLLVGLVPGETNTVTLQAMNQKGKETLFTFTIEMPESLSVTTAGWSTRTGT